MSSYTYTYRYIHIHINIYIHTSSTATTTMTHPHIHRGGEALETKESQQHQKQAEPHHSPTPTGGGGDHDPSTGGGGGVGDAAPYIPQILILILKKIQASCNLPAILYTIQAGGRFCPRMGIPARTARSESIRMPGHTKRKEVFLWSKRWWCSVGGDVWKRLGIPNCPPLFFGVLSSEIADFVSRHD